MDRTNNPFADLERMFERMTEQFDETTDRWSEGRTGGGSRPAVDVADHPTEVVVTATLPGFSRDEVELRVSDRTLRIEARHSEDTGEETEEYVRRERRRSSMSRSVRLPTDVDAAAASATLQNGVLTVTLPKAERDDTQQIDID